MENLTLDELNLIYSGMLSFYSSIPKYEEGRKDRVSTIIDKIKQAIADKEFEEKRLQF